MSTPLSSEQIKELLAPKAKAKPKPQSGYTARELPPQLGPLKSHEKEQRCVSSGYYAIDLETNERYYKKYSRGSCRSPTHWTLDGIPLCSVHAMYRMSELILELRGEQATPLLDDKNRSWTDWLKEIEIQEEVVGDNGSNRSSE